MGIVDKIIKESLNELFDKSSVYPYSGPTKHGSDELYVFNDELGGKIIVQFMLCDFSFSDHTLFSFTYDDSAEKKGDVPTQVYIKIINTVITICEEFVNKYQCKEIAFQVSSGKEGEKKGRIYNSIINKYKGQYDVEKEYQDDSVYITLTRKQNEDLRT